MKTLFEPLQTAWRVAGDGQSFLNLAFVMLLAHVNRHKNKLRKFLFCFIAGFFLDAARTSPFSVRLRVNGALVDVLFPFGAETEFWSIRSIITEVLIKEVYRPDPSVPLHLVIDAGANFGLATLYLHTLAPETEFVCYEPSSETYRALVRNLEVNHVKFRALQKALTNFDGLTRFELGRSSMERGIAKNNINADTEEVPCAALGLELDRLGIQRVDLLKFDVEREEVRLLEGLGDGLSRVQQVIGETHSPVLEAEVGQRLTSAGFVVKHHDGHTKAVRIDSISG